MRMDNLNENKIYLLIKTGCTGCRGLHPKLHPSDESDQDAGRDARQKPGNPEKKQKKQDWRFLIGFLEF